jgi:menaquinone-dependent protoporphyrinogen oxidase
MSASDPDPRVDVLVAYASRHGATRGIAERICVRLHEAGLEAELREVDDADQLPARAAVVLGSPVYDQRWPPEADAFVRRHLHALVERELWLFSVGSFGDRRRGVGRLMTREPRGIDALCRILRPRDYRVFAGTIRREQWPLPARMFFHALGGRLGDNRDWPAIDAWADGIATALTASAKRPAGGAVAAAERPDPS